MLVSDGLGSRVVARKPLSHHLVTVFVARLILSEDGDGTGFLLVARLRVDELLPAPFRDSTSGAMIQVRPGITPEPL